jgi:hypothetical protein
MKRLGVARRQLLLAGLAAPWLYTPAWAFDRVVAGERYRAWLAQFHADIATTSGKVPRGEPVTAADVERWCERSVAPGSRAVQNLAEWLTEARRDGMSRSGGEIVYHGPLRLALRLMTSSIPAGQGGLYPEVSPSKYPDRVLTVWYMHIHAGEHLAPYFENPKRFSPYRLPPDGQLARNAYPFLLFEDGPAGLRFGGFGQEWYGALQYAYNVQFH